MTLDEFDLLNNAIADARAAAEQIGSPTVRATVLGYIQIALRTHETKIYNLARETTATIESIQKTAEAMAMETRQ